MNGEQQMRRRQMCAGDRGFALVMTALVLVPLLTFAAFGVDLASWYSRISYLQKSADAAALAGTVWMPDFGKAELEAKRSLRSNGIVDKDEGGSDDLDVEVARGSKPNSIRVTVTDNSATQFFSQVIHGSQRLTRDAEAQYNLTLPLGSPLNYFGGDRSKIPERTVTTWSVAWPTDYASRVPRNVPCNIGSSASHGLGRWIAGPAFSDGHHTGGGGSGNRLCEWEPLLEQLPGVIADYDEWPPDNMPCNANGRDATTGGRWPGAENYQWNRQYQGGEPGNRQCVWSGAVASSLPPNATTSATPANRPCNIPVSGRWNNIWFEAGRAHVSGPGYRLCAWTARTTSTTVGIPNPIAEDRSPGFWAAIGGPGDVAAYGDAFSSRCTGNVNCSTPSNQMHSDEGYWYVIKMPASGATTTSVRVFDAAYNPDGGSGGDLAGDTRGVFGPDDGFTTTYRVYRQPNPLDFATRVPVGAAAPSQTPGSCHWDVRDQAAFRLVWTELCSITPQSGETYLLNVRTSGDEGEVDGVNGYAVEAVSSGTNQPAVYAHSSMAMRNNIQAGEAEFYLAEVGPQYAGKTLVVQLFDAGDASGNAYLRPVMPGASAGTFTDIGSASCAYTASPAPNPGIRTGNPDGERTSPAVGSPTTPTRPSCEIQTTRSGTQQFNDEWLTIKVQIPADYTCTLGRNPEAVGGSCWWGVKYDFSSGSNDVTTWKAQIEGNPVHLTD